MEFNREKVLQLYAGGKEELRAQRSRSNSIEFYYTEKILRECLPKNAHILELGCGTGYYGMLFADLCASYTGIDLSPDNIAEFRRKIDRAQKTNLRAEVGDATALTGIPDNAFDAVLCLGPMYHLPPAERQKVFQECYRVGREHACFAFAYINRIGVYAGACVNNKPVYLFS